MFCEYRRYGPDVEAARQIEESDSTTRSSKWLFGAISFKDMIDFYNKKEEESKHNLRRNERQVSRDSDT